MNITVNFIPFIIGFLFCMIGRQQSGKETWFLFSLIGGFLVDLFYGLLVGYLIYLGLDYLLERDELLLMITMSLGCSIIVYAIMSLIARKL